MKKLIPIKVLCWWIVLGTKQGLVNIFKTKEDAEEYCSRALTTKHD